MRRVLVVLMVALGGCAAPSAETVLGAPVHGARCSSIAGQHAENSPPAKANGTWVRSIDPEVVLSAYQLYCMKDTPLGL